MIWGTLVGRSAGFFIFFIKDGKSRNQFKIYASILGYITLNRACFDPGICAVDSIYIYIYIFSREWMDDARNQVTRRPFVFVKSPPSY